MRRRCWRAYRIEQFCDWYQLPIILWYYRRYLLRLLLAPGSALDFGPRTGTGSYTVRVTNSATFCTSNMSGSAVVGIDPLPTVYNVVGGGSYCAGAPGVHIGLSGSTLGISYQLLIGGLPAGSPFIGTGLPIDFGLHTAIGSYTVVATNGTTGCVNTMSGSAAVSVNPVVVPSVTVSTGLGDTVCAGNLTTFTATATDEESSPLFTWTVNGFPSGSGNTYSYIPANGDMVSVTLTSSATCATPAMVSSSINMTVLPQLMPSVAVSTTPGIIVCQGTVVSFAATPTNGGTTPTYLWLKNGLHVGTSSTFSYIPADGDIVVCELTTNYRCPLVVLYPAVLLQWKLILLLLLHCLSLLSPALIFLPERQ